MAVKVGDVAPDFTLLDTDLQKVSLSSFKGKNVVLLFFPAAFTGVCTKEMCTIRDNFDKYSKLNAQVFAISVDSTFAQKVWKEQNNLNFPVLSDFNKDVSKLYGAFYDVFGAGKFDMNGVSKRAAFVIDKNGKIKYAEVLEDAGNEPNYDAIVKALEN